MLNPLEKGLSYHIIFVHFNWIEWKGRVQEVIPIEGICPQQGQTITRKKVIYLKNDNGCMLTIVFNQVKKFKPKVLSLLQTKDVLQRTVPMEQ